MVHRINCSEIWGGIRGDALDAATSSVRASLFSRACDGGKGGDIYYLSVCDSDLLTRIAIADVMGHGERVSKTSKWLYDSLQANMNSGDGTQVLTDLNRAAIDFGFEAMATAVIAAFYTENSNLYFSYAGHHDLLLKRGRDNEWKPLESAGGDGFVGLVLGVDEASAYVQNNTPLEKGDQLFLYTDGVVEGCNSNEEEFGIDRLLNALRSTSGGIESVRGNVLSAVLDHTDGSLEHDDVTFMAIEITG
jgi:sigma-B regulation protein RsbU (phosphoserine phosphatase)